MHDCLHCDRPLIVVAHRHSATSSGTCLDMGRCEHGHENIAMDNTNCLGAGEDGGWTWYQEPLADDVAFADALSKGEPA